MESRTRIQTTRCFSLFAPVINIKVGRNTSLEIKSKSNLDVEVYIDLLAKGDVIWTTGRFVT